MINKTCSVQGLEAFILSLAVSLQLIKNDRGARETCFFGDRSDSNSIAHFGTRIETSSSNHYEV
jgi:hypothetical protein